jgi:ATP-dependent DNA helicase RecG
MEWHQLEELLMRESAAVEWKKNVADPEDVVRTLCAFANDIEQRGGGRVVCGVEEITLPDGAKRAGPVGLDPARRKELKGIVPDICRDHVYPPLTPRTEEIAVPGNPERAIVVFEVKASRYAHAFRNRNKETFYWIPCAIRLRKWTGGWESCSA